MIWLGINAHHTGKSDLETGNEYASAAMSTRLFVGNAGVVSLSVRSAWKKMSGACPATASHGNALTVGHKTVSGISKK